MAADSSDGFGTRLRRLRERAGLTQEALAERAGISAKAVSALERGERRHPYPHTVRALAAALELSGSERATLEAGTGRRGQRTSLPVPPSALIGREDDVKAVAGLLLSDGVRLLTLTGPGGVGKTRLALEAARELAPRFSDGAVLVSFAAVFAPHLVLPTLAQGLGVRGPIDRPLKEAIEGFLRSRALLLVLDNLEHLPGFIPEVSALLATAPRLRVLATSRSPLRLQGEHLYPVRPLTPPWAVELFEDRSRRFEPEQAPGDEEAVLAICHRLDCLPLAIELAAAQTRVLPARALLGRLDSAFRILVSGPRDLPERQQALRRTIDWSHDLLTTSQRALFRRLAVFSGGWTLDAAAAVAQVDDVTAIELHTGLLDGSLITRQAVGGEFRFGLLQTIGAYAAERFEESGETGMVRDLHARHFRAMAQTIRGRLFGPTQEDGIERLELENDNLGRTLAHLLERGALDEFGDLCFALWLFWSIRGHLHEGRFWTEAALATANSIGASGRARLLVAAASTLYPQGRYDAAAAALDEAARLGRQAGDGVVVSWTLAMRGNVAAFQSDVRLAARLLAEAEAVSRDESQREAATRAMVGRARIAIVSGDLDRADRILEACEEELREVGAPWNLGAALSLHGRVSLAMGDSVRAEDRLREAVVLLGRVQDAWAMLNALSHLADAAALRSDASRAAQLYGAAETLIERTGASTFPVWASTSQRCRSMALAALGQQRFDELRSQGRTMALDQVVAVAAG